MSNDQDCIYRLQEDEIELRCTTHKKCMSRWAMGSLRKSQSMIRSMASRNQLDETTIAILKQKGIL